MGFSKKTNYYTGTVYEWNLPTGWTCPYSDKCLVKVDPETGKQDNRSSDYRCYASSAERFPSARKSRWLNYLQASKGEIPPLPKNAKAIRIHASGDFFSQPYFDQWMEYIRANPSVEFWAYTKSLRYWVARKNDIPDNLSLNASYGGKEDHLIAMHGLSFAIVVQQAEEAEEMGLAICDNDDLARIKGLSFAMIDSYSKHKKTKSEKE